jgi:hypothetical protein
MACAAAVRITFCPPMPAKGVYFQKENLSRKPISVRFDSHGVSPESMSTMSWEDYGQGVQTRLHLGGLGQRHQQTPLWTMNDTDVRRVLLAYLESRIYSKKQQKRIRGDERKRYVKVMRAMEREAASLCERLKRLVEEYVAHIECTGPFCVARRKTLTCIMAGLDRQIILATRADVFHEIIRGFYRVRLNSTELSQHLGNVVTPYGIRAILHRLNKTAAGLGFEVDLQSRRLSEEERAARAALKKARAERREQIRADKAALKKRGRGRLCRTCGTPTGSPTAQYCGKPCTKKKAENTTRARRRAAGRCGCGAVRTEPEFLTCSRCRDKARAATARCAEKRKKKPASN